MEVILSSVKEFSGKKGYGFNALLRLGTDFDIQVNGLRIFETGIMPPAIRVGRNFYPTVFLPRDWAAKIYNKLIDENGDVLSSYLKCTGEEVIQALVINDKDKARFKLAQL